MREEGEAKRMIGPCHAALASVLGLLIWEKVLDHRPPFPPWMVSFIAFSLLFYVLTCAIAATSAALIFSGRFT